MTEQEEVFLTVSDIAKLTGLRRSTITSYKARGLMPQPDKQYGRTPLWSEQTIHHWRHSH